MEHFLIVKKSHFDVFTQGGKKHFGEKTYRSLIITLKTLFYRLLCDLNLIKVCLVFFSVAFRLGCLEMLCLFLKYSSVTEVASPCVLSSSA